MAWFDAELPPARPAALQGHAAPARSEEPPGAKARDAALFAGRVAHHAPARAPGGRALRELCLLRVHDERRLVLHDHVLADDDLLDPRTGGDVVHDVEHRRLEDRAEAAGAAVP